MIKGIVRRPLLIAEANARQWSQFTTHKYNRDKTGRTAGRTQDKTTHVNTKIKINYHLGNCIGRLFRVGGNL